MASNNLKVALKRAGVSAKELSRKTGIPYDTIISYANKGKQPRADRLKLMASTLNVSEHYLAGTFDERDVRIYAMLDKISKLSIEAITKDDQEDLIITLAKIQSLCTSVKCELGYNPKMLLD